MKPYHSQVARLAATALLCALSGGDLRGQSNNATPTPDLSGYWELPFDGRKVPQANLLPSVTPAAIAEHARRDAHAIRWCNILGMPFLMDSGRPLDIRQGTMAVIVVPEVAFQAPRYLYLNRSAHIPADEFDPTTLGDAIARWEGDTLVVDTVGFHPERGITSIPGGGFRTDTTRLVERYRLVENGNVLSVTFTWTDPQVFRTPHTYEFRYHRLPGSYEARTWLPCDPYNEERARFLEGSPMKAIVGTVALLLTLGAVSLTAQQAPDRRIEGTWVRVDTAGAGSFGGLAAAIPPAQLMPQAAATRGAGAGRGGGARGGGPPVATRPNAPGVPYIVVDRPCGFNPGRSNGALLVNPDSGGVHVIEHRDEVILAGERGGVRHVYLDGRPHPNPGNWTPTPSGHSIGRYEGNVLIVETVGLTAGGVVGGGQRTPATRLTERFEVSPDGRKMTISYTWQDAAIYQRPHTYSYVFDRIPAPSYAFEDWCDASDPIERQGIVPPVQR